MESVIEELAEAAPAVDATNEPTGTRVDVIKVDHRAGGRRVLHEVSLSIAPGELVALAGGSGAGKTTLLEIMAGLRRPADGTVLHDGVPTGATEQAARGRLRAPGRHHPPRAAAGADPALRRRAPAAGGLVDRRDRAGRRGDAAGPGPRPTGPTSPWGRSRAASASGRARRSSCWPVPASCCWTSRRRASTRPPPRRCWPCSGDWPGGASRWCSPPTPRPTSRPATGWSFLAREGHLAFAGTPTEAKGYFDVDRPDPGLLPPRPRGDTRGVGPALRGAGGAWWRSLRPAPPSRGPSPSAPCTSGRC